jgi:hypothetical protein
VSEVLCQDVEFRALTPRRVWEAQSAGETLGILRGWFDDATIVDDVLGVRTDVIGDRHGVTYRFAGEKRRDRFVIEQHAYYTERAGRIDWMRLLCSGFRPADAAAAA